MKRQDKYEEALNRQVKFLEAEIAQDLEYCQRRQHILDIKRRTLELIQRESETLRFARMKASESRKGLPK